MGMFSSFNTPIGYNIEVISNSTILDFTFSESNNTIIMHVSNMTTEQTFGFCRLCIPKSLMPPPHMVIINDGLTQVLYFNDTIYDNGTHMWIYFSYEHSINKVVIVPEFTSFLMPPLFMVITLLAVIIRKRKHRM
jgi:hypothetical protein